MKCMHCSVEFFDEVDYVSLATDIERCWVVEIYECPACKRVNLFLVNSEGESVDGKPINVKQRYAIRPRGGNYPPAPAQVPAALAENYRQACLILTYSPNASAALSRACLSTLLREVPKADAATLEGCIQQVIQQGELPEAVKKLLAAVSEIGAFTAHPLKGILPGLVQPTEVGEPQLNLEVLDALFDFYYVQPSLNEARRAAVNATLEAAGKLPL